MTEWMIDTFLATSALILLILVIRRPVAAYFGPIMAYSLWIIPAARLFMPSLTKPEKINIISAHDLSGGLADSTSTNIALINMNDIASVHSSGASVADNMMPIIMIWGFIAIAIFIFQMGRYLSMRDELLANAHEIGCQDGVTLIQSDLVSGPCAFGIFKKYIAVPMDFNEIFAPEMREMAIAHEMTHHRSYDLIINLAAFIFLCLTWFSPLSWFAWNKFRIDQESACDARVLKGADQETKHIYGQALARGAGEETSLFLAAMNSPKTILTRLRRLKMPPISKTRSFFGKLSILTATAIALPLTATSIPIIAQDEQTTDDTDIADDNPNGGNQNKIVKTIIIKDSDSDNDSPKVKSFSVNIDENGKVSGDDTSSDKNVKIFNLSEKIGQNIEFETISKEGKIFYINGPGKLSQEEIDELISKAKKSAENIDFSATEISKNRNFIIRYDKEGDIKTFNIVGDDALPRKFTINIDDDNGLNAKNITKIQLFKSKELNELKENMRNNVIPSIKKTLKNSELSAKEQTKIIRELEAEIDQLDKTLDKIQI